MLHGFIRRGYLDDRALADQLVYSAVERKGQGRMVIAQSLAKRGIPRDVVDAAMTALPDDDADRALEFARQKARSMRALDHEVALRRLVGQLARRGYGVGALDAARQALDEL
ncbi:regulatory protein RecX [Microbacterium elymi]|uniref:regulatory protein RecX n=1 Tax=Microbacterium elymi TaxID=2909587 RepID=UPI003F49A7EC